MSKQYSKVQQTLISIFVYFLFIHTTNFSPNQGHIFFKWVVLNILFVWHIWTTILVLSFILLLFVSDWAGMAGQRTLPYHHYLPPTRFVLSSFCKNVLKRRHIKASPIMQVESYTTTCWCRLCFIWFYASRSFEDWSLYYLFFSYCCIPLGIRRYLACLFYSVCLSWYKN